MPLTLPAPQRNGLVSQVQPQMNRLLSQVQPSQMNGFLSQVQPQMNGFLTQVQPTFLDPNFILWQIAAEKVPILLILIY